MKKMTMVMFALVGILTLLPALKVSATCPTELGASGCFENKGYRVEIVPDTRLGNEGLFPAIVEGNSVFTYKISRTTSKKLVSFVDLLIPAPETGLSNPSCRYTIGKYSGSCSAKVLDPGTGDPLTGFGLGLKLNQVIRAGWVWPLGAVQGTITLTIPGKLYAAPNATLLVAGFLSSDYPYGQILTPSSSPSPTPNFAQNLAPQVPLTTFKREAVFGVEICTETKDSPGYPTTVYTCDDPLYFWPTIPLSQVDIQSGTLMWIGEGSDPRFPSAYIVTEGSTCIQKCNKYTGLCTVGPRGCTPAGSIAASATASTTSASAKSQKVTAAAVIPEAGGCTNLAGCTISGSVYNSDETPIADSSICVRPSISETPLTGDRGRYSFTVPQGWSGTAAPITSVGFKLYDPLVLGYADPFSGSQATTFWRLQSGDASWITGHVYVSGDTGLPLDGVVMFGLPCAMTGVAAYEYPASPGYYYSQVTPGTTITITPKKEGYTFNPPSATVTSAGNNGDITQNFTAMPIAGTYTITGSVTSLGSPLSGVVMSGLPGDPVLTETGFYSATVDSGWSGTVTPRLQGYTFDPDSRPYTNVTFSQTGDYTSVLTPANLVPVTLGKSEKIGNVDACDQFEAGSGCSIATYSCKIAVEKVCDCPIVEREYWGEEQMNAVTVTAGKLQWVGADNDPTCPTTYLVTEGSTCVQKCSPLTGICKKYPTGCTP